MTSDVRRWIALRCAQGEETAHFAEQSSVKSEETTHFAEQSSAAGATPRNGKYSIVEERNREGVPFPVESRAARFDSKGTDRTGSRSQASAATQADCFDRAGAKWRKWLALLGLQGDEIFLKIRDCEMAN